MRRWLRLSALLVCVGSLVGTRPAHAYEPATTHAGLTERAVAASHLHQALARIGRPLGLFEPVRLGLDLLGRDERRFFSARLDALDPAGGYRPGPDGVTGALRWVMAGSVLAMTPPERAANHFLNPRTGKGLDDGPGLTGLTHSLRLLVDGGTSVRGMAAGTAFTLDGKSALDWIWSPQNDLGLPVFFDNWERSVALPGAREREDALARALMALGGVLSVLEDMGQPAFVRNDFRVSLQQRNQGSAYEQFVVDHYGQMGLPAATGSVSRPDVDSFFAASDGQGLANRTQRSFFSEGNLPADVSFEHDSQPADVARRARETLAFPEPTFSKLVLGPTQTRRYLKLDGHRVLAYETTGGMVHFLLDDAVFADTAATLLPEIAGYGAGLIDHLVRARLDMKADGNKVSVRLAEQVKGEGALRVFAEDGKGIRREMESTSLAPGAEFAFEAPAGTKKLAAVIRGKDVGGPFVAAAELVLP
jgi:hypothetical protein